jgi:hypothetical protein
MSHRAHLLIAIVVAWASVPTTRANVDYIGPAPALTNNNFMTSLVNTVNPTGQFFVSAQPWTPTEPRIVRQLWCVYGQDGMNLAQVVSWRVAIWNSLSAFIAAPKTGNVVNQTFTTPDLGSITTPYGVTTGGFNTFLIGFSLSPTVMPPGPTYYIAIYAESPYPANGLGGVMESAYAAGTGAQVGANNFFRFIETSSLSLHDGTLGYKLVTAPDHPGDLNCDGSINAADAAGFAEALLNADDFNAGHPDCIASNADLNHDGLIDGEDIPAFINCVLTGICP